MVARVKFDCAPRQSNRNRDGRHPNFMTRSSSPACTALLVAAVITPLGGLVSGPLAIAGAIFVLFAIVVAALECQGRCSTK
jgi:hypothetical protein